MRMWTSETTEQNLITFETECFCEFGLTVYNIDWGGSGNVYVYGKGQSKFMYIFWVIVYRPQLITQEAGMHAQFLYAFLWEAQINQCIFTEHMLQDLDKPRDFSPLMNWESEDSLLCRCQAHFYANAWETQTASLYIIEKVT